MSELPDGSGTVRRTPRVSDGGAPVSGALAIVLAVIAVLAGFFILRSISDNGDQELGAPTDEIDPGGDGGDGPDSTGEADPSATTTPVVTLPPTTTTPAIQTEGATVIVANANSQGGSAGAMTRELETGPRFLMEEPVNANASVGDLAESVIYFDVENPAAQGVANSLALALGGVSSVLPLPDIPLTADGDLGDADVLLMLGNDKANRTIAELNPEAASGGVSVVTNPPVVTEATG